MGPFGVVEGHPFSDHPSGLEAIGDFFEIDRFLLERPPQTLDEDVVHASTAPIHRDAHPAQGQKDAA